MDKRKRRIIGVVAVISVLCFFLGITVLAQQSSLSLMGDWGDVLKNSAIGGEEEIYAIGTSGTISNREVKQAADFCKLTGMTEEEAREQAVQYVMEREALYQEAIKNGYGVTDEQVWEYLEEMKQILHNADNSDDVQTVISRFDSEEDYWDFEFTVYQKNLPIQNYVHDMEQQFVQENSYSGGSSESYDEAWQEYFARVKETLVEKENFKIVE